MKRITWVAGVSGSGKETFIRSAGENPDLLQRLGWVANSVVACEASLEHIGQSDDDPVNLREQIMDEVPRLLEKADTVLIKWQLVDSDASRPERIKKLFPEAHHCVVELRVPEEEAVKRLKPKWWWHDVGQESQYINHELELVAASIGGLGFERTILSSTAGDNYAVIN